MYLLVNIDRGGYIRSLFEPAAIGVGKKIVHRETRNMQNWAGCYDQLQQAKAALDEQKREDAFILSLTSEGGGECVWLRDDQRKLLCERLNVWKGCYGGWTLRRLNG